MIFFNGDWTDAGVAAVCGLASGIVDYGMDLIGGDFKILTDALVGVSTGLISGIFYEFSATHCLPAIFLGTLFWFFYGIAFVISLLEIIAGELETGVTRFIAVSVKTLVLSLGAGLGLMIATASDANDSWFEFQEQNCSVYGNLSEVWWRIPLYLLCTASVLGHCRLPLGQYWNGLIVALCAYEAQYQTLVHFEKYHERDNLDSSTSNVFGAATGVVVACSVSFVINRLQKFYNSRLLDTRSGNEQRSKIGNIMFCLMSSIIRVASHLHIGRESENQIAALEQKLDRQISEVKNSLHTRVEIELTKDEEKLMFEAMVESQDLNVWSILIPTMFQLVPGGVIVNLWVTSIFPSDDAGKGSDSVFMNLMVIAASLALGLLVGFLVVQSVGSIFCHLFYCSKSKVKKQSVLCKFSRDIQRVPFSIKDESTEIYKYYDSEGFESMHRDADASSELSFPIALNDRKVTESFPSVDEELGIASVG